MIREVLKIPNYIASEKIESSKLILFMKGDFLLYLRKAIEDWKMGTHFTIHENLHERKIK